MRDGNSADILKGFRQVLSQHMALQKIELIEQQHPNLK